MKVSFAAIVVFASSATAFTPGCKQRGSRFAIALNSEVAAVVEEDAPLPPPAPKDPFATPSELPGVAGPLGFFDPLGFASQADAPTMKRYREAEVTHGRVGMLAVLGFLAGEFVEGSSFLFDSQISGPGITHLSQVPSVFWILLTVGIGASESTRLNIGWVSLYGESCRSAPMRRTHICCLG
jgi:Chlorophyll A-B binding protein